MRIGELAAGLVPPGVLNVVTGGDDLGPMLTSHPGVDKISFTGSTVTGRRVQSRIVREEQFGPVLPLIRFDDYDDVIDRVNASELGLVASIWGRDEGLALALASRIVSGAVWLNESMYISPTMSFGGAKQSGIGVEGGLEGLLQYTSAQTIIRRKMAQSQACEDSAALARRLHMRSIGRHSIRELNCRLQRAQ